MLYQRDFFLCFIYDSYMQSFGRKNTVSPVVKYVYRSVPFLLTLFSFLFLYISSGAFLFLSTHISSSFPHLHPFIMGNSSSLDDGKAVLHLLSVLFFSRERMNGIYCSILLASICLLCCSCNSLVTEPFHTGQCNASENIALLYYNIVP